MNIIRKIKINELTPITFVGTEKDIIDHFDNFLNGLSTYTHVKAENLIYFVKENKNAFMSYNTETKLLTYSPDFITNLKKLSNISIKLFLEIFKIKMFYSFKLKVDTFRIGKFADIPVNWFFEKFPVSDSSDMSVINIEMYKQYPTSTSSRFNL